jgi:predicted nuclease with TOPRIM domain
MLFFIVFKKPVVNSDIDYDRIQKGYKISIEEIKQKVDSISKQNKELYVKLQEVKSSIPDRRLELLKIGKEIKKINELYKDTNYRDSSDVSLIQRLSR